MKKHYWVIGLTGVATLTAMPAMAEPTLDFYGALKLALEYVAPEDDNITGFGEVKGTYSFLGLSGETELMSGLTAYFVYEVDINGATGGLAESAHTSAKTANLQSKIGVKGGWGAVEVGRAYTTYANRVAFNTCGFGSGWDCFDTYISFEQNKTVRYLSPEMGGFSFEASVELDGTKVDDGFADDYEACTSADANGNCDSGNRTLRYQVGGTFAIGMLSLGAAYDSTGDDYAADNVQDLYGATATVANETVSGTVKYENINRVGDSADQRIVSALVKFMMGKNTLLLHYADGTWVSEEHSEMGVGVQHSLTDNFMAYAEVHSSDDVCFSDINIAGGCMAAAVGGHYKF